MADDNHSLFLVQVHNGVHVMEFINESLVDQMNIERLGDELGQLVDRCEIPKVVISFANLSNVSSAVLGVLIATHKKIHSRKGELRLAAIPDRILEVFKLTRLDKMLNIYKTTEEAQLRF